MSNSVQPTCCVLLLLQGSAPDSEDFMSASETKKHVSTYLLREERFNVSWRASVASGQMGGNV